MTPSASRPHKLIVPRETADEIYAAIETSKGTFVVRLAHERAPRTVQNFIDLAEGTAAWYDASSGEVQSTTPFYDGSSFHRIVEDFVIQGGCPLGDGRGNPGWRFADEIHPELRHDEAGVLSMANSGPDSNGSQFFVTLSATPALDDKHAVFGRVVAGMSVIDDIASVPTDLADRPTEPVRILRVVIERR
ncbi:MAG: peptidylprolyl isomerase [Myxococcota bacterium]|nr:peptidylprolyl isomerase [Myxococcota bacterium]